MYKIKYVPNKVMQTNHNTYTIHVAVTDLNITRLQQDIVLHCTISCCFTSWYHNYLLTYVVGLYPALSVCDSGISYYITISFSAQYNIIWCPTYHATGSTTTLQLWPRKILFHLYFDIAYPYKISYCVLENIALPNYIISNHYTTKITVHDIICFYCMIFYPRAVGGGAVS